MMLNHCLNIYLELDQMSTSASLQSHVYSDLDLYVAEIEDTQYSCQMLEYKRAFYLYLCLIT